MGVLDIEIVEGEVSPVMTKPRVTPQEWVAIIKSTEDKTLAKKENKALRSQNIIRIVCMDIKIKNCDRRGDGMNSVIKSSRDEEK